MLKWKHESSYHFPQDDKELFGNMAERENPGQPYIQTQTCVLPWREPEGYHITGINLQSNNHNTKNSKFLQSCVEQRLLLNSLLKKLISTPYISQTSISSSHWDIKKCR